jgi:hypothetical protein
MTKDRDNRNEILADDLDDRGPSHVAMRRRIVREVVRVEEEAAEEAAAEEALEEIIKKRPTYTPAPQFSEEEPFVEEIEESVEEDESEEDEDDVNESEEDEDDVNESESAEDKPKTAKRLIDHIITGSLLTEGTVPYYRYFIAIAVMCFLSIVLTFLSLNASNEYRRKERTLTTLHERSVVKDEQRYELSSKSAVTNRLKEHNIELIDLAKSSRLIEK